jgi:hypothetical protein
MSEHQEPPREEQPSEGYEAPSVEKIDTEDSQAASGPGRVSGPG